MRKKQFDELLQSVKEMRAIERGEIPAARIYTPDREFTREEILAEQRKSAETAKRARRTE